MKKIILGLVTLFSISAFAETIQIKIDRQMWGENVFAHYDGQSYQFFCSDKKVGTAIYEFPNESNGNRLTAYNLSDVDCSKSLSEAKDAVSSYTEYQLILYCSAGALGSKDCAINP